ncbi:MAG TPA: LysM peptidoglycan-binding domain-containing protein, partial [Polyangiaceae bacterium]
LVAIIGTAKVDKWDRDTRVARATLIESLDVIERGAKVGPLGRRFDVVAPVRNEVELWAHIAASLYPYELYGQNQVVFIDKGQSDGLIVGNRLFVITRGDEYRKTLFGASDYAAASVQYESEKPATVQKDGALGHGDDSKYPEEIIGEIRVLKVREHSATCLVVSALREIEPGERVVARRGY